jgi:peptidoglycan/LPS O-acetylase OafA/YrhL
MGVDLFFALSGFLIMHLLVKDVKRRKSLKIGLFLWRRWLRLTPAYAACIVLQIMTGTDALFHNSCKTHWWSNMLFINNYPEQLGFKKNFLEIDNCLGQSWSIAVEFQFYLISPLVVLLTFHTTPSAVSAQSAARKGTEGLEEQLLDPLEPVMLPPRRRRHAYWTLLLLIGVCETIRLLEYFYTQNSHRAQYDVRFGGTSPHQVTVYPLKA